MSFQKPTLASLAHFLWGAVMLTIPVTSFRYFPFLGKSTLVRPLAFYPFTNDRQLQDFYLERVMSGGSCVNDALLHPGQHDLPFGGVGASGMGHYHGYEGFATFSKLRPVFYQARFSALKFLAPPYGKLANTVLNLILKIKK